MSTETDNEARFRTWWSEHRAIFFKIARSFVESAVDEAELVQEMRVQLWRSLPRFAEACAPSTWIYRVCFNTALTWKKGERRRFERTLPEAALETLPCARPGPVEDELRREQLAALYRAIRQLAPAERSLVLMLLDGRSYREIAEVTGLSENHVGVALTRARKKLTELLQEVRHEHG